MRASILINNYNYAAFLGEAIDSALAQDWDDLEVVVVDDGSTDDSRAVISSFGERIVVVLKENGGQASSFNAAFQRATGDVVFLLDADDWFLPTKVSTVLERLAVEPSLGWCFHPISYDGAAGSSPRGAAGVVDVRTALRSGRPHRIVAPATSGLCFTRGLLSRILPMPEEMRVPLPGGARGTAADAYVKIAALALSPGVVLNEELAVQRLHDSNAYTRGRSDDPSRAALELQIACELRERWPELRRYALQRGMGGLKRLRALPGATETDAVVDGFMRGCTTLERLRVGAHATVWRARR